MKSYLLTHLADHVLLKDLDSDVTNHRHSTAWMLARIAEVDARKLYLPAACSSMYDYCVRVLRMSEDSAYKRIRVARTARQFPAIFPALADGRLNLSGVILLASRLRPETADELLPAVMNRTKAEIELLLAQRFPRPDLATVVQAIPVPGTGVESTTPLFEESEMQLAPGPVVPSEGLNAAVLMEPLGSRETPRAEARARVTPLSPGRFSLQVTVDQETYDQLRYSQSLLGHSVPSGDIAEVLKRALDALVGKLERRKFTKSARSRPQGGGAKGRYIPTAVRSAVWERDGGRCTFESESGKRCEARTRLEYDHVTEVARGGQTSVANLRLRCRGHNQHTAEQTFGAEFMRGKREEARRRTAEARARAQAKERADATARADERAAARADAQAGGQGQARAQAEAKLHAGASTTAEVAHDDRDVIPWLRALGYNAEMARRGAANCAHIPDASLEERVKVACRSLARHCIRRPAPVAASTP
jgi:hypothetical protein